MSSRCYTWKEIVEAKDTGRYLTKTQSAKAAYLAILKKYVVVKPEFVFYHKAKGVWQQKLNKDTPAAVTNKKESVKTENKEESVKAESKKETVKTKNKKETPVVNNKSVKIMSKEEVKKVDDKNVIGFIPVYKNYIIVS